MSISFEFRPSIRRLSETKNHLLFLREIAEKCRVQLNNDIDITVSTNVCVILVRSLEIDFEINIIRPLVFIKSGTDGFMCSP